MEVQAGGTARMIGGNGISGVFDERPGFVVQRAGFGNRVESSRLGRLVGMLKICESVCN